MTTDTQMRELADRLVAMAPDPLPLPDLVPEGRPSTVRRPAFVVAVTAVVVILVIASMPLLLGGSEGVAPMSPTESPTVAVTVPVDSASGAMLVTPPVDATWTLEETLDDWMTEPVLSNGEIYAVRRSIDGERSSGWDLEHGEPWKSYDGVSWIPVWIPAEDSGKEPPPPSDDPMNDVDVFVDYLIEPEEDLYDGSSGIAQALIATGNGSTWREINLRPYRDDWLPQVAEGALGWLVYSPPMAVSPGLTYPQSSNLGLWYTADTEKWYEVTDLGPLVGTLHNVGEVGVVDMDMLIRDDDVLVFVHVAHNIGFGQYGQLRTEIWRLTLTNTP